MLLSKKFKHFFNVCLQRIYLHYITGIIFFKDDEGKKYRTWGAKDDENFDDFVSLALSAQADLFYYEVLNRKIYLENVQNF